MKKVLILFCELKKMCSGNLESIKFNSDGKAKITRSFTQKNLRNKKIQPYSDIIDIPTNSDTSITIIYNQVPTGQQQLAMSIVQQL